MTNLSHLATAVPLTAILATGVFLFYIVFLKWLLKPTPNINWKDAKQGTWNWTSWFRFIIQHTSAWAIIMIIFMVFVASLYNPSMLNHSLFYDIFQFRTNDDSLAAAHAIDYLLIPLLFFFCVFYWGKGKLFAFIMSFDRDAIMDLQNKEYIFKAALMCAFMVFFHEAIWFFFYYARYWQEDFLNLTDVVIGDLTFLVMIFTFFLATKMRYKEEFSKYLAIGAVILAGYMALWYFLDDMRVTTVPFTVNGIPQATPTIYYGDPLTSVLEVSGWLLVFSIFVCVIVLNHRRELKRLEGIPSLVKE